MGGAGWVAVALLATAGVGPSTADTTAIVDVGVADVDTGRIQTGQTVLVADGRILARQPAGVPVEPWVRVIEGGGRTLLPGLVDAHVHSDSLGLGLFLANGVTSIREMNGADRHLRWRDAVRAGSLDGPRMLVASELLTGTAFQGIRFRLVDGVEDARTAGREAAAGVPVTATLAVHEILTATGDRIARLRDAPEVGLVSSGTRAWWATVSAREPARPGVENRGTRFMRAQRTLVRGLAERGVPVLAGTDTPNPLMVPGFSLHEELDALVAAGLTPRQALAAATTVPGQVLPFHVPLGRIEVGHAADLVAVDGDPFQDLGVLRRPSGVMAGGRWYDRDRLDAFLEDARKARGPADEHQDGGAS